MAEPIELRSEALTSVGSRHRTGINNFYELSGPLKSIGSLCSKLRSNMDHCGINNGMQRKGSFNPQ